MRILIKGMEMPTRCEECPFCIALGLKSTPLCSVTGYRVLGHGKARLDNCPLVPVPPHGRLIDAEALMGRIEHDTPLSSTFEKVVRRYIKDAPTIIPAEEDET